MNTTNFQPAQHEISVQELKQKLDQNAPILLLDVREPHEYEFVHLQSAQLIPLNELPQHGDALDRDAEIVIYCHHGQRSMYAAAYLYQNGFQNIKSLTGGIDQWAIEIDSTLNRY
jgi:rhodanese-related sulfurtransferase